MLGHLATERGAVVELAVGGGLLLGLLLGGLRGDVGVSRTSLQKGATTPTPEVAELGQAGQVRGGSLTKDTEVGQAVSLH